MSTPEEDLQEILSSRAVSTGVINRANHSFSIRSANCFQASPGRQRLDVSSGIVLLLLFSHNNELTF